MCSLMKAFLTMSHHRDTPWMGHVRNRQITWEWQEAKQTKGTKSCHIRSFKAFQSMLSLGYVLPRTLTLRGSSTSQNLPADGQASNVGFLTKHWPDSFVLWSTWISSVFIVCSTYIFLHLKTNIIYIAFKRYQFQQTFIGFYLFTIPDKYSNINTVSNVCWNSLTRAEFSDIWITLLFSSLV